jgi:HD-like signal output (HDOD) protein
MFPSLPEISIRLREELDNPNRTNKSLAKLLQVDMALAGFILKTARSAWFLSRFTVKSLEDAVRRLGAADTYNVALAFFLRSTFNSNDSRLALDLKDIYLSSAKVSAISSILAGKVNKINHNRAMLGGLLQDIGAPLIMTCLYERKEIYDDPALREQALDELCPLVGTLIMETWDFDDDLMDVVKSRKEWGRDHDGNPDLADVVLIARFHSMIGTPQFAECPSLADMPAFQKMPEQALSPDQSMQLVEESRNEITNIEQLLTVGMEK